MDLERQQTVEGIDEPSEPGSFPSWVLGEMSSRLVRRSGADFFGIFTIHPDGTGLSS